jgi:hypothetical protein
VADIEKADVEMVKAILNTNGVRVYRETLPSGQQVLKVESLGARQAIDDDPDTPPIVSPGDGTVWRPGAGTARDGPASSGGTEQDGARRLRALEAKVDRIAAFLGLSEEPPPPPGSKGADGLSPDKRARIEALNRQFEARLETLRKENLEAVRKVLEEPPGGSGTEKAQ